MENLNKEKLISLARQGNDLAWEVLLKRYKYIINLKASKYYHVSSDNDDIWQEGLIGFYEAINSFSDEGGSSLERYIGLCVERKLITYVTSKNRLKHKILNEYISIYQPAYFEAETDSKMLVETIKVTNDEHIYNPYRYLEIKENFFRIKEFLVTLLTELELKILNLYLYGYSYKEIAKALNRNSKSVDNAMQRIRRKLLNVIDKIEGILVG